MNEARAIARCEEAAALLPPRFRRAALQMPDHRKRYTEEFRLRAGQPPAALLPEGEVTLPYFGADSRVTPRDLAQMVDAVTDYSRYACAETLRQGFLCLHGGFRLGVMLHFIMLGLKLNDRFHFSRLFYQKDFLYCANLQQN